MQPTSRLAVSVALAVSMAAPVLVHAQATGALTFAQIQQRFRGMNEIHIAKCDRNQDGLIERNEYPCVQGIYQVMYKEDR